MSKTAVQALANSARSEVAIQVLPVQPGSDQRNPLFFCTYRRFRRGRKPLEASFRRSKQPFMGERRRHRLVLYPRNYCV